MLAQVKEEATVTVCCGDGGTDGEGIIVVWDTADVSYLVQLLGTNVVVLQRGLTGGGTESTAGAGKVGTTSKYFGEGGSG